MASFSSCNGSCTLTVTGFMAFYLESYSGGAISGRFITKIPVETSESIPNYLGDAGLMGESILIK